MFFFFSQIKQKAFSPQGTQSAIKGESYPPTRLYLQLGPFITSNPSSINHQVLWKLCAKFDIFVTSVTFRSIFCTKRPDQEPIK